MTTGIIGDLSSKALDDAVRKAARDLVAISHFGDTELIHLPMLYPNGSAVTVRVGGSSPKFLISDYALAYREALMMGGERTFRRNVEEVATLAGVEVGDRNQIWSYATSDQLASAVAAVGCASYNIMQKVQTALPVWSEEQAEAELYHRLVGLFGQHHVFADAKITGASSINWRFAARVVVDGRQTVFDTVAKHHSSVYSAVSKFGDLARLENSPSRVAVVESKEAMGAYLTLIGESANVIEVSASDATLIRLAA